MTYNLLKQWLRQSIKFTNQLIKTDYRLVVLYNVMLYVIVRLAEARRYAPPVMEHCTPTPPSTAFPATNTIPTAPHPHPILYPTPHPTNSPFPHHPTRPDAHLRTKTRKLRINIEDVTQAVILLCGPRFGDGVSSTASSTRAESCGRTRYSREEMNR